MGLDVYFRRDIANVLRSVAVASAPAAVQDPAVEEAIARTLVAVGLAFGLELVGPGVQKRPGVSPGLAGLLWAETPRER